MCSQKTPIFSQLYGINPSLCIRFYYNPRMKHLTHWGRVTHICVGKLTIIGSDKAIIWTNAGILLIGHLGTIFSEILIEIHTFSFKKIDLKMSSGKWRPSCLGLIVLMLSSLSGPASTAFYLVSLALSGGMVTVMNIYALELYPTAVANTGLGVTKSLSTVVIVFTPFVMTGVRSE